MTVARTAFGTDGLDLPTREIARRAGLGTATIYRHFPSRPDLVHAVLTDQVAACAADMQAALSDPDPWRGLQTTVRRFSYRQAHERGLNTILLGAHPAGSAFAAQRRAHADALNYLFTRARAMGAVRLDATLEDVRTGLLAIASLPPAAADQKGHRLANLILAGLATASGGSPT
ncbi:TetR/AcrR family transcriptional regulator [Actinoplanes friuliensis]|uniref:TetR/AcrR family transcriptional regulator n=1 Tax=Actinoplanes friuliensis TaxID=196914 RepID=UPI001EE66B2B|nr:TetR/AcrR family transcriptional regulator [Actinoplanes friuliensis]